MISLESLRITLTHDDELECDIFTVHWVDADGTKREEDYIVEDELCDPTLRQSVAYHIALDERITVTVGYGNISPLAVKTPSKHYAYVNLNHDWTHPIHLLIGGGEQA